MFALIKRVLDLAGSFSPAARRSLTWGMVCNILKAFFMAGMLGAVFWALENRDHLDAVVALQCLGILAVSVIGQYVFQYLVDITMDAQGFHIFRDLRLRVGDRLKAAPMGYFSEQRLSAVTTTLTTTVHQLEEFMTICLTGLTGGVAMAVIMSLFFLAVAWPIAAITFAGIAAGLCVLNVLRRRATSVTREVTAAQEAMADKVIEYARGMAVLRTFATPDESLAAAKASFQQKRAADYHQEAAAQGILKLYALVFNLASCAVLFTACALYLNGALPLSWALTLLVAAFMIYGELIHANDAAFLTKKIEGELDRVDEVCDIPKQNATDAPLAPADFGIEMNGVSVGQDDAREPHGPILGRGRRRGAARGPGRAQGHGREPARARVDGVPERVSVQRHRGEQHQVRHAERHPCRRGGRRQARPLPRVHHAAAAGLRHGARGGRRQPLGRGAPAHLHRARHHEGCAHRHLGRGHELGRS